MCVYGWILLLFVPCEILMTREMSCLCCSARFSFLRAQATMLRRRGGLRRGETACAAYIYISPSLLFSPRRTTHAPGLTRARGLCGRPSYSCANQASPPEWRHPSLPSGMPSPRTPDCHAAGTISRRRVNPPPSPLSSFHPAHMDTPRRLPLQGVQCSLSLGVDALGLDRYICAGVSSNHGR